MIKVRDEGTKLYNAIRDFSNTHKDDFKDSRFLSVTGENIEDPSEYVKREVSYMEGKHLNDAIVDKDMSMKDLDKMLEADKYLLK